MNSTLESEQDSCYELELFFKDAMKTVISISDIVVCVVNILFSLVAVFANILILYALYKASSLHSPSKAMLCSLALSDLGVGAIVQPLFVAYRWAQINGNLPKLCTAGIVSHIEGSHFSAVSFLTMTAISLDRLFALLLRLRYHRIVTLKRVVILLGRFMGFSMDHKSTNLFLDQHCFDSDLFSDNSFLIYENIFLFTSTSNSTWNTHTALDNFEWSRLYPVANSIQKISD